MSDQHTISHVANIAIAMSTKLSNGYNPLHIVTRQNCFVNYLNNVLLYYPPHTLVADIELNNSIGIPFDEEVICANK